MIVQTRENKDLVIPKSLGNFVTEGSGGGITPEEAAEIASAVTEEAISEYDTELQVDLEDIRDAVSGNSEDISALSGVTETISQQIGSLSGLTDDIAAISGQTSANTQDIGTLSGDVETNALAIANLENNVVPDLQEGIAAAGGLAESANTKVEALSAVTSGLAVDIETLSAITSGMVSEQDVIYDYEDIRTSSTAEKQALWNEISSYSNTNKKVWIKQTVSAERHWFLCYSFDAPYLYFVAYTNSTRYLLMFNQNGSITFEQKYLQFALSAGSGISMSNSVVSIKAGEGLGFSGDTLVVSGATGGGKTPIVLEEHYGDPTWTAIYNAVAQSAVTMGVEEFAKNYDIYIKKLDDQENPYSVKQAVGFAIQQGEDWDETAEDWVQTTWVTFNTFESVGNNYWLLSTGSRGLGVIGGFDGNVPHPKSAWINIDASGNVTDYDINYVDEGLAQYSDNGTDYAFSMYLCCLLSDAERYRGNLQNFRKNYNGVNGNFFFRFVIDIDGTEYEAEYYWDQENQQLVKIVFQTYKAYLQSILNS